MPIKNILLAEYNFVYTFYQGDIDDIQVRAYSDQLTRQLAGLKSYCEIIDFSRNADFTNLSSQTLNRAGALERERINTEAGPLAVLVNDPLSYGLARTYTAFAADTRTKVLISYSLTDCINFMGFNAQQNLTIKKAISQATTVPNDLASTTQVSFNYPTED